MRLHHKNSHRLPWNGSWGLPDGRPVSNRPRVEVQCAGARQHSGWRHRSLAAMRLWAVPRTARHCISQPRSRVARNGSGRLPQRAAAWPPRPHRLDNLRPWSGYTRLLCFVCEQVDHLSASQRVATRNEWFSAMSPLPRMQLIHYLFNNAVSD